MRALATLTVRTSDLNLRSEPSASGGNSTVIRVLHKSDAVALHAYHAADPSWAKVATADGVEGFVKRMLLYQGGPGLPAAVPEPVLKAYNDAVWKAANDYDHVTYELGAKDPRKGTVDCSGWVAFINRLGFNAANAVAGVPLFSAADLQLLNTHSDHQVSIPGYKLGQLFSLEYISTLSWRPGLVVGINFADYDWEQNQGRVFEIDHIVQTVRSPEGTLYITQSSSGGGGVNRVKLVDWLKGRIETLRAAHRVHVADILGLGGDASVMGATADRRDLELPELDTSRTPAG